MLQIFDFDGTLIKENSSRILEEEILKEFPLIRRIIFYQLFFGYPSLLFNKLWGVLSRFVFNRRDVRLFIFLSLTWKYFESNKTNIFQRVGGRVQIRPELFAKIDSNTIILSNGLTDLIESILKTYSFVGKVEASNLDNFKISALGNFAKKVMYLKNLHNFSYVTDDPAEVSYLMKELKGVWKEIKQLYYFYSDDKE